jgi:hypothetical protein
MTFWMDAIDKLRLLGYAVNLDGEKLRYAYLGKGNPSSDEIIPLLEVLKAQKAEILNDPYFLIEQTLLEINQAYPKVRDRLIDTSQWKALFEIEQEISRTVLEDDFESLERALQAYKQAVLGVERGEAQGNLLKLLGHKRKGPGTGKP